MNKLVKLLALATVLLAVTPATGLAQIAVGPVNCSITADCIVPTDRQALSEFRATCRGFAVGSGYSTGIVLSAELIELGAGPLVNVSVECNPFYSHCEGPGEEEQICIGINKGE